MTNRVRMVAMALTLSGSAPADVVKIWSEYGAIAPAHRNHCGPVTQQHLREFINQTPIFIVKDDIVSVVVRNHAGNYVAKRANRVLQDVQCADGTTRTYGFWDEGEFGTLVIALALEGTKRPVMLAMIRNKNTEPCYEKWIGLGEQQ